MTDHIAVDVIKMIFEAVLGCVGLVLSSLVWWLIKTIIKATTEIAVLNNQMASVIEDNKAIPKMREDLNALHAWRRDQTSKQPKEKI